MIYLINDKYIIFSKNITGEKNITNSFEGLFKIDSNKISNKALKDNQALSNDIETRVSKRQNKNSTSKAVLNSSITTGLDKDLFISELAYLKEKNYKLLYNSLLDFHCNIPYLIVHKNAIYKTLRASILNNILFIIDG